MIQFNDKYSGRKVLLTGHSGFKGFWMTHWLKSLGADVCGVSLSPGPHSGGADREIWCDIRDGAALQNVFDGFRPELVFHLAAQALVRESYRDPSGTFSSNVMGSVNLLECCRNTPSVKAVLCVSSDKCYENRETSEPYRETDPLGGFDPYSASKGAMEIVIASYRRSFFDRGKTLLASARAGNVIGGGDEAADRLIPDLVRAFRAGRREHLRNPSAVRPWQHVLEPLSGYLMLGERLLSGDERAAAAWNFGPDDMLSATVGTVAGLFTADIGGLPPVMDGDPDAPHEAGLLRLDASAVRKTFGWHSVWSLQEAVRHTAGWYLSENGRTAEDLQDYLESASMLKLPWLAE